MLLKKIFEEMHLDIKMRQGKQNAIDEFEG